MMAQTLLLAALLGACASQRSGGGEVCADAAWRADRLPVLVTLDPSAADWAPDMLRALTWWDDNAPGLLLSGGVLEEAMTGGSIVGVVAAAMPPYFDVRLAGLTTTTQVGCEIVAASVLVSPDVPAEARMEVLAHELGHVLSLHHDDAGNSIMAPSVSGGAFVLPDAAVRRLWALYPHRWM